MEGEHADKSSMRNRIITYISFRMDPLLDRSHDNETPVSRHSSVTRVTLFFWKIDTHPSIVTLITLNRTHS